MTEAIKKKKNFWLLLLAVIGPGLITAVADNDAGGVATYTVAASLYGMASQYLIIPTTLLLALTQYVGSKISIITGKGLGELIRERYGVRVAVFVFIFYFLVNQGVVLQNVSGLKASLQLFNLPWQPALIAACLLLVILIVRLSYNKLQRIFLFMILFYLAYVVSALLAGPNWHEAIQESLIKPRHVSFLDTTYWFSLIAVLGTTITAWGQFFVSSFIVDKGLTAKDLKMERIEIFSSAILTNFFSWMIALSVTYTIFVHAIPITGAYDAALAIKPFAGQFASILFAAGLFGASLLGLSIVPLATSYVFTEMFGYERTLNANFKKGRPFYVLFIVQIIIGLVAALLPKTNLFGITLYADYLNGAMLPVIFYFLIKFSEDKLLMNGHASGKVLGFLIRAAALIIMVAVAATFFKRFF